MAMSAVHGLMKRYSFAHVSKNDYGNNQYRYLISVYDNADNSPVATIQVGQTFDNSGSFSFYTSFWQNVSVGDNIYNKPEHFTDEQVFYTRLTQFYGVTKKAMEKLF